jgi:AraC-like DNA-binding protein
MRMASDEYASLRFSTTEIVEQDRLPFWRDFFCREIVQVDIEPKSDLPLSAEVSLISCPGLQGMWAHTSIPVRLSRTAEMLDDGIDNIALVINLDGRASVTQGDDATLNGFDAIGVLHAEPASMCRSSGNWMALMIPRQALSPAIADVKRATMQVIPSGNASIGLLVSYIDSLKDHLPSMLPELRKLAVSHIQDLIAMAFGATGNGSESVALSGGVRAARLHAIKADVLRNLGSPELTLTNVAKRHRVTPRYIHMIFELEGISFSEYVLEQRLLRALHLMTDRRFADWKVTTLASEAGFGDLSYFNRTFRRRFAMTPSEARKLHAERAWMHSADELTGKGESS